MAQLDMMNEAVFVGERYISLTTYRKNGNQVATPVWFAEDDDKIYIMTMMGSGKTKRIRNNGHVKLASCNARGIIHGETINGMARLHQPNSDTGKTAQTALHHKYGLMLRFIEFVWWIRGNKKAFVEITPQ